MSRRTIEDIKKAIPETTETIEMLAVELDRIKNLKTILTSEGGKELINALRSSAANALRRLLTCAKEKPDINSLLTIIFEYGAFIEVLSLLRGVEMEKEIDDQLVKEVKELQELANKV